MNLVILFLLFFKYGILCFGGGYMLVPMLEADLVGSPPKPLSPELFSNLLSIAQITPGPIGINTATFVGYMQFGIIGGIIATIGMISPPLIMTLAAIKVLHKCEKSVAIQGFLTGMRPASCGFIWSAVSIFTGYSIFSQQIPWLDLQQLFNGTITFFPSALMITIAAFLLLLKTKLSFILILLLCAAAGACFC